MIGTYGNTRVLSRGVHPHLVYVYPKNVHQLDNFSPRNIWRTIGRAGFCRVQVHNLLDPRWVTEGGTWIYSTKRVRLGQKGRCFTSPFSVSRDIRIKFYNPLFCFIIKRSNSKLIKCIKSSCLGKTRPGVRPTHVFPKPVSRRGFPSIKCPSFFPGVCWHYGKKDFRRVDGTSYRTHVG